MNIVVFGSINIDLLFRVPRVPGVGETLLSSGVQMLPGGKGANQAVAARRLGAQVELVGRVGDDDFADPALASLRAAAVGLGGVARLRDYPTGMAGIVVDPAGRNAIVVAPGANHALTAADVARERERLARADALLAQLEIPLEVVIEAARRMQERGGRVILNPAPAQPLPDALLRLVDVIIPNEHEVHNLLPPLEGEPPSVEDSARRLHEKGIPLVVVTLGERGCLVVERDRPSQWVPAFPVAVIDTVAAGDAFVAAFSVAWLEGSAPAEAARFANAAGALAATRPGAQPALPERPAVAALLEQQGARLNRARA